MIQIYNVLVDKHQDKYWHLNNKLPHEGIIIFKYPDGSTVGYLNGILHSEVVHAFNLSDGTKEWYLKGVKMTEMNEAFQKLKN